MSLGSLIRKLIQLAQTMRNAWCACACVRACVRARVCVWVSVYKHPRTRAHTHSQIYQAMV